MTRNFHHYSIDNQWRPCPVIGWWWLLLRWWWAHSIEFSSLTKTTKNSTNTLFKRQILHIITTTTNRIFSTTYCCSCQPLHSHCLNVFLRLYKKWRAFLISVLSWDISRGHVVALVSLTRVCGCCYLRWWIEEVFKEWWPEKMRKTC